MGNTQVTSFHPVQVGASPGTPQVIKNISGATLYYRASPSVSSSSKDGELLKGEEVTVTNATWIVTAEKTDTEISVTPGTVAGNTGLPVNALNYSSFAAALSEAKTLKRSLYVPYNNGVAYEITAKQTVTVDIIAEPGATIKKSNTFASEEAILVATNNITIENLNVDGNRSGGAKGWGIEWTGKGGRMVGGSANHHLLQGVVVESGGELRCYDVEASDNYKAKEEGDGFYCAANSRLQCYGTSVANENGRAGAIYLAGALSGCHYEGEASRNSTVGVWGQANEGGLGNVIFTLNNGWGLLLGQEKVRCGQRWTCGTIEAGETGYAFERKDAVKVAANGNGTPVESYGSYRTMIGSILASRNKAYALARAGTTIKVSDAVTKVASKTLTSATAGFLEDDVGLPVTSAGKIKAGTTISKWISETEVEMSAVAEAEGSGVAITFEPGTSYGEVGTVVAESITNPAIADLGNSQMNTIGVALVRSATFAWVTEGSTGSPSDNVIGTLIADQCGYGIWKVATVGTNNRIDRLSARDCYNKEEATANALISFYGAAVTGNVVGSFTHRTVNNPAPLATFAQNEAATGNVILFRDEGEKLGTFGVAPVVQPKTTGTSAGFVVAKAGNAAAEIKEDFEKSTFTGNKGATAYTISDVVLALKQLGLLKE